MVFVYLIHTIVNFTREYLNSLLDCGVFCISSIFVGCHVIIIFLQFSTYEHQPIVDVIFYVCLDIVNLHERLLEV